MAIATINRKKTLFTRKFGLNLEKEVVNYYIWGIGFYGAETLTLVKVEQKYQRSLEM